MMQINPSPVHRRPPLYIDLFILGIIGAIIYGLTSFESEWSRPFTASAPIDLGLSSLPRYTFYSTLRALIAYALSFAFTMVVGLWISKDQLAEKVMLPLLDIMQSIPVLGFLPGLVLSLIRLFPHNNVGLELSAILMIFTGQVWNMVFSFYSSLKSIPSELREATKVMDLSFRQRLSRLELPFSAANLAWNSIMSMAGGWFFLSVCEAFVLGDQEYRLPGLGSYMALASAKGDSVAMLAGVFAMVAVILAMDLLIWRPVLRWVHKFRLENDPEENQQNLHHPQKAMGQMFFISALRGSRLFHWRFRFWRFMRRILEKGEKKLLSPWVNKVPLPSLQQVKKLRPLRPIIGLMVPLLMIPQLIGLWKLLHQLSFDTWKMLIENTSLTLFRVILTLLASVLWVLPVGIWLGLHRKHIIWARPIIQLLASFPAPMLYPMMLYLLFKAGVSFTISSPILTMLGVQWYVLFNVLAAAMFMPQDLIAMSRLTHMSKWQLWPHLYIPAIFPSLVTGLITAAGGAFNASIVSEYVLYQGKILTTPGLGSTISQAAAKGDYPLLAGSLTLMVLLVIILNRTLWAKLYHLAQTRFRMDL